MNKNIIFSLVILTLASSVAFADDIDIVEETNKPSGRSTDLQELMSEDAALMKAEQNATNVNSNTSGQSASVNSNATEQNSSISVLKDIAPKHLGSITGLVNESISDKDVKAIYASNLAEALRHQKGVFLREAIGADPIANAYIRGFGRERIGLLVDGIPLMDYDAGRNDYELVLLNGFSHIDIYKGYISPSYANSFAAINLTSYTPQKELEARLGADIAFNSVGRNGLRTQKNVFVGTNGGTYFLSVDYKDSERDAYAFSQRYDTGELLAMEGYQINSKLDNASLKLRAGFMPNEDHEYSLNFYYQKGSKGDMLENLNASLMGSSSSTVRLHQWSSLQKQMLYLLGHSNFTEHLSVDTKLYYQAFDNSMIETEYAKNYMQRTDSVIEDYNDDAYGALMSVNYAFSQSQKLKLGFHLKRDSYINYKARVDRPKSKLTHVNLSELKSSVFGEYDGSFEGFRVILGASYERNDIVKARNYDLHNDSRAAQAQATIDNIHMDKISPKGDFSAQLALLYDFNEANTLHLSVGKKLNFPTLHQRYFPKFYPYSNTRNYVYTFNYEVNKSLRPESVLSYELGYDLALASTHLSVAAFYNDYYDSFRVKEVGAKDIKIKNNIANNNETIVTTNQPIYKLTNGYGGQSYGGEISFEQGFFTDNMLILGANYSYLYNKLKKDDQSTPELRHHNHIGNVKIAISPIKQTTLTMLGTYQSKPIINDGMQWLKGRDYLSVDVIAHFYVAKGFSLKGGVLNLSDRDNYIRYATELSSTGYFDYHLAGRRYMIGFDYNY